MESPKDIRNAKLAEKVIKNLKRRRFEAHYCASSADAVQLVKQLIPAGSSVSWGGSMTIRDMGLTEALYASNLKIVDRDKVTTQEDKRAAYLAAFDVDYYLASVNAMSEDGVLVNIDGNGNRVAAITWGPKRVILVVGMNKIAQNVEAALSRARATAAPINTARLNLDTPCTIDGVCHNCNAEHCICNYIHFQRNSYPAGRQIVILVNEDLGY